MDAITARQQQSTAITTSLSQAAKSMGSEKSALEISSDNPQEDSLKVSNKSLIFQTLLSSFQDRHLLPVPAKQLTLTMLRKHKIKLKTSLLNFKVILSKLFIHMAMLVLA